MLSSLYCVLRLALILLLYSDVESRLQLLLQPVPCLALLELSSIRRGFPIVRVIAETTSVFEAALYSWFAADFATSAASTSVSEVVSIVSSTGSSLVSSVGSSVNFDALKSALCSCMLLAIQQSVCVRSTGAQFSSLTVVSTLAAGSCFGID